MEYWVYILECADGSLYTGISNNLEKRLAVHNAGKGAKFTKGRLPVRMRYVEKLGGRSEALKRELAIKSLSRVEKIALMG